MLRAASWSMRPASGSRVHSLPIPSRELPVFPGARLRVNCRLRK